MTIQDFEDHVLRHARDDEDALWLQWFCTGMSEVGPAECPTPEFEKGTLGRMVYGVTRLAQLRGWTLEELLVCNRDQMDAVVAQQGAPSA